MNTMKLDSKTFYRKIFYQCRDYLDNVNKHFCILTGPRKTGKTFCLYQLKTLYASSIYFNFKSTPGNNEHTKLINQIFNDKSDTIYLLDEITYLNCFDVNFSILAEKFTYDNKDSKVKVLITGSQATSIAKFAYDAFASDAHYIRTSFIDFEEWLVYRNKINYYNEQYSCTEGDYLDYILNSSEFLGIIDNKEYLTSCLNETLNSNLKSYADCYQMSLLSIDDLDYITSFLYTVLLKLHNRVNFGTFVSDFFTKLDNIKTLLTVQTSKKVEFSNLPILSDLIKLRNLNSNLLRDIILFLMENDLIVVTNRSSEFNTITKDWLANKHYSKDLNVLDFFKNNNLTVKYPLFYVNILKEISKLYDVDLKDIFSSTILGSVVECNIRGLCSYKTIRNYRNFCIDFEYRDEEDNEVDIIDYNFNILIEISVSDKRRRDLHFESVPNHWEYKKVVTSKTKEDEMYIPYYKYILQLSRGNFIR